MGSFNLRIESLVIESVDDTSVADGLGIDVSISELRVLLLRDEMRNLYHNSYEVSISELRVLLLRGGQGVVHCVSGM